MAVVAVLAGTVGFGTPTAAHAGQPHISINVGSGWTHDTSLPLFDVSRIAAGWSSERAVEVRNDSRETTALTLTAINVVDNENGCTHAEASVDTTCAGANAGELGHEIVLSLFRGSGSTPLWRGSLYELRAGLQLDDRMAPRQVDGLRLLADLPSSVGNEVQSDTVSFGLRLTLAGAGASTSVAVEGIKISRPPHGSLLQRVMSGLPVTGSNSGRLVPAAIWLTIVGGLLASVGRRGGRRRSRSPS
jgi:hypothetical protein